MDYQVLAILMAFVFTYSALASRLERGLVSGAIVFAAFGLLFGPEILGFLTLDVGTEGLRTLAELTLALVLFTDASNANLGVLKRSIGIPERLLLIGLPLTLGLGFGVGVLLFDDLMIFEIAILAIMLAPTDAALGKVVVTDKSVPSNIREGLNLESGLNDGICVPILFVFLALAAEAGTAEPATLAFRLVAEEIGIGLAVGLSLTYVAVLLLRTSAVKDSINETWVQIPVVALAVACFAAAQALGGSGFIASFTGGLLFGWLAKEHKDQLLRGAEGTGDTLAVITWVVFGAAVIGQSVGGFEWKVIVYAVLSLTFIRMLPVLLVLVGTKLRFDEKLFISWFGPRGLASIVFIVIVLHDQLPGGQTLAMTVVCTVLLSIVAHGLSARPLVAALSARIARSGGPTPEPAEPAEERG